MQHNKTILQVLPELISGGVEKGTIEIAKFLKKSGYNPLVISNGGPLTKELDYNKITHIKLNVATKNPLLIYKNAKILSTIISEYKIDLLHARSRAPAWSCYIASKKLNKNFITTFHGIYNGSGLIKNFYNSIMIKGEKVIAVSNFSKEYILKNFKINDTKIEVIHRGVDKNCFNKNNLTEHDLNHYREKYKIKKNLPVILLPARITEWKGHMFFVDAIQNIRNLDFQCIIVGDCKKHPNFVKKVINKIVELKLQNKIKIFGHEENMLGLYGISDIVVSSSIRPESFGRSIIEAQAMEKLVIATNIGGASETIIDNITGFHVYKDNIDDLSEKIKYCLSIINSTEEQNITLEARKHVIQNFSLDKMLIKTLDLYNKIL